MTKAKLSIWVKKPNLEEIEKDGWKIEITRTYWARISKVFVGRETLDMNDLFGRDGRYVTYDEGDRIEDVVFGLQLEEIRADDR